MNYIFLVVASAVQLVTALDREPLLNLIFLLPFFLFCFVSNKWLTRKEAVAGWIFLAIQNIFYVHSVVHAKTASSMALGLVGFPIYLIQTSLIIPFTLLSARRLAAIYRQEKSVTEIRSVGALAWFVFLLFYYFFFPVLFLWNFEKRAPGRLSGPKKPVSSWQSSLKSV